MRHKLLLLYSWFVHVFLFFFPDVPCIMRLRGWLYGLGMNKCGRNFQVAHSAILNTIEDIEVGDNVYIANYTSLIANGTIKIGNNSLIGPNCVIAAGAHLYADNSLLKESKKKNIEISANCWISANCTVAGGWVPYSSILAAGSVWTGRNVDLKPKSIYGGVPARFIKER